jgi:C4-dicarboxylate-specific signal transduction histidine kinase
MQAHRFEAQSFFGGWSYPLIAVALGGLLLVMPRFLAPEGSAVLSGVIGGSVILLALVNLFGKLRLWWRLRPLIRRSRAISALYAELHELISRQNAEPHVEDQIRRRFAELRSLQEEEADEIRQRFETNAALKPGEGWKALREARELLAQYEDPSPAHSTASRQD